MSNLSFAQSYILASRVRSKLTKEAANPKASLRNLVLQANMLDNLMDHIANESKKREKKEPAHVTFALPNSSSTHVNEHEEAPSVSVIEYDSDSESEYDSDEDDDDYYYSDDEEDLERSPSYRNLPSMNLSVISEEDESQVPELSRTSESEESDEEHYFTYAPLNIQEEHRPKHVDSLFVRIHHERSNVVLY